MNLSNRCAELIGRLLTREPAHELPLRTLPCTDLGAPVWGLAAEMGFESEAGLLADKATGEAAFSELACAVGRLAADCGGLDRGAEHPFKPYGSLISNVLVSALPGFW